MTGKRQGPTPGSPSFREYSYSKMTGKRQGPTPGVRLREVSVL